MDNLNDLSILNIMMRIALAIVASGVIGFEREHHNRPAGLRTHILVGLGAAMVALMESYNLRNIAMLGTSAASISVGRLTAQVISGIGFLGAGTILVHKHSVSGLTTAASLWNVACLGVAAGYGYFGLCMIGAGSTLVILTVIRRMMPFREQRRVEISFYNLEDTVKCLNDLFNDNHVRVLNTKFTATRDGSGTLYVNTYLLDFMLHFEFAAFFQQICDCPNVTHINMIDD